MSISPSFFESSGGALAPAPKSKVQDQLAQERQDERINAPKLEKFLNRTLDSIASLDQSENLKIHNSMVKNVAYYDGRWDGYVRNGVWVDNEPILGEILGRDNDYKKQIDKLLMEMSRSRVEQECEAVAKFNSAKREAAEFAQRRIEVNQERIETEAFQQGENQSLLLKTTAYRYSFFDTNADSVEQSVELKAVRSLAGEGSQIEVCRTCGMTVDKAPDIDGAENEREATFKTTEAEAKNCPHCGDTETKSISVGPSEAMSTEQSKKTAGRVVTVRPDATMVQLDLNARSVESSSFVRWRLVMRRCDWEAMYPNTRIPSSDESVEARHRSESQNQPSNSDWPVASENTGGDQFEKIEGELVWLDPKVYQRYRNQEDEKLKGGQVLLAGTGITDQFTTGCCVVRIAQTILDLYPSNKNRCWTMCVYGLREHALHGSGTASLLGPQDTINELNAAIQANAYYNGGGRDIVRSGAIEGGQLPSLSEVAYINDAPPEVLDIAKWAVGKVQPEGLSSDVYMFREAMRGSLQDAAGTSSLSMQGAADTKALGTATGVEASRDQAVGRMIPNRKLQGFAGSEWAVQVLELEHENYTAEVFLELAGKGNEKGEVEFTERGVRTFFEMDVRTELSVKPKEGSWTPTTPAQDRANATDFGQIAGKIQDPELLSLLAKNYGISFDINEWGAAQRLASMRLEEYARVSKIISQGGYQPSPEMVAVVLTNCAEWARPDALMDDHAAMRNFWKDWFRSDEGRNADTLLRMVVRKVFELQGTGTAEQAKEVTKIKIEAQEPERQLAEQQSAEAQQGAAAADEQGKQEEVMRAIGEQKLKEHDREHQAQTEIETDEHRAGLEIAKHAAIQELTPDTPQS